MKMKELLCKGLDIFNDHGGSVGHLVDAHGRVCAAGAMKEAVGNDSFLNISALCAPLSRAAQELYGNNVQGIAWVNDHLGGDAVRHCYEYAIKQCEE
ncbi:MAG TPA: hypothetical protein VHV10_04425 [Ktedonobacteraceae bacterium]|jgi:hypothetical protein|nr:hypothetical protein [Ktedonobacteraceae bacterium]